MRSERWKVHLSVAAVVIAAMTLALTPAVADSIPDTDEYPDVAFLARNDVPFDAQTAASMAAQLGAPMFITNPNVLADAARDGIADLDPDVLIVAGGVFAVSDEVAQEAAEACDPDCTIDRRFGAGRDETAADLATIAADYGFDRPVLQGSNQVVGGVHVGGTVHTDAITVQNTGLVSGLNADRLDGMHADDFLGTGETAADSDLLDGVDAGGFMRHLGVLPRTETQVGIGWNDGFPTIDLGTFTVPDDCGDGTTSHDVAVDINLETVDASFATATGSAVTNMVVQLDGTNTDWEINVSVTADIDNRHNHARPVFTGLAPGEHTVAVDVVDKSAQREDTTEPFREVHLEQRYGAATSLGYSCG